MSTPIYRCTRCGTTYSHAFPAGGCTIIAQPPMYGWGPGGECWGKGDEVVNGDTPAALCECGAGGPPGSAHSHWCPARVSNPTEESTK